MNGGSSMTLLSILDYGIRDEGQTSEEALAQTVERARLAEHLGYHRFWVAEHHNVPAFTSSAPEMLMMHLLNQTTRIRIGSGGIMLPHYSPLKVAENLKTLTAFFPDRVDAGLGNNPGVKPAREALNEYRTSEVDHQKQVADLVYYLQNDVDEDHRFSDMVVHPNVKANPIPFVLTTGSPSTAQQAGKLGLGYVYGKFLVGMDYVQNGINTYRYHFKPSPFLKQPLVSIALSVAVAPTEEEAAELERALDVWMLGKHDYREFTHFPSVETAAQYKLSAEDKDRIQKNKNKAIIGTPTDVQQQLQQLIDITDADELLIVPLIPGEDKRRYTLEVLAEMEL